MRKLKHAEIARPSPDEVRHLQRHPITVVLDNVRSLYNVGSIFRTADAALVERIILTGITGTPDHHDLHKTALGAQDTVPWAYDNNVVDVIERLKKSGYTVAALELTDTPTRISHIVSAHFPLCLVIGHEVFGVSDGVLNLADMALEIPQYGAKQSMNVAVAFGIAIYGVLDRFLSE